MATDYRDEIREAENAYRVAIEVRLRKAGFHAESDAGVWLPVLASDAADLTASLDERDGILAMIGQARAALRSQGATEAEIGAGVEAAGERLADVDGRLGSLGWSRRPMTRDEGRG